MAIASVLLCGLLLGFAAWLLKEIWVIWRRIAMVRKIPGPKWTPIIGTVGAVYHKDPHEHMLLVQKQMANFRQNGMHTFKCFLAVGISIYRSDTIEAVLTGAKNITKSWFFRIFLESWLGNSLLTSSGTVWKEKRNLLTPTFHFKILEDYAPIFNKHGDELIKIFDKKPDGEKFDVYEYFVLTALDSICESAMGKCINALKDQNNPYVTSAQGAINSMFPRFFNPLLWSDFIFGLTSSGRKFAKCVRTMHDYTEQIIRDRKANFDSSQQNQTKKRYQPFLDLLLQVSHNGSQKLTEKEMRDEVSTFVFAGHDTTGTAMCWTTYLLGLYPEIQETLQEELEQVLGPYNPNRPITTDDVKELKYLDRVIKESMRLYPPVSTLYRTSEFEFKIGEHTIPEGVNIMILVYELHRDPKVFPDPEKFDPDRFLPENCEGRPPYAYIPFSASSRNCIGQRFAMLEMKIVLSKLFQRYHVTSLTPRDQIRPIPSGIMRPQYGCPITLKRRY